MAAHVQPQNGLGVVRDDQDSWLNQATKTVKRAAYYMRQAVEESNLEDALRHSAVLLGELRTSHLGPQKYFELYMSVFNEMRDLEGFFLAKINGSEEFARELYHKVQHAGNVVPRLYLLCTVGSCAIRSHVCDTESVLRDMEDMCKGVQHPIRGLFLRAYLVQQCRGLLPDEEGGSVDDSIRFLLENFIEMNKLWVRMRRQGDMDERAVRAREKEREQLADLVGKNLTQLSQLENLRFDVYKEMVLPRILEQVVSCKDELAQGYLMECITAAFPDEFQIGTIDQLLDALPKLEPGVVLASVLGSMLDRLAQYTKNTPAVVQSLDDMQAFHKISNAVEASTQAHADLSGDSVASMYGGLLTFAEVVYPDRLEYVDNILEKTASVLERKKPYGNGRTEKKVMDLLSIPLEKYELKTVLGLRHFTTLIDALGETKKKDFAMRIATMACQRGDVLTDAGSCVALLNIVERILTGDEDDVEDDASLMAKLMHCFNIESTSDHIRFLMDVFERISKHGTPAIKHVGPAVVFSATRSIHASRDRQSSSIDDVKEWYVFLVRVCKAVANASAPGIAIQLLLRVGVASQDELLAYECFEHACILYEDFIFDSKECSTALYSIIHALYKCGALAGDSRRMLAFKATSYCSKLLRRKDQCRAILACCHIYWQEKDENSSGVEGSLARDGASVLKLLERAERTVHALVEQNTLMERSAEEYAEPGYLMVDILNKYAIFKKKGVEEITAESIDKIIRETDAVMQSTHLVEAGDVTLQAHYKTSLVALKNTTS
ncbi:hypothetical protein M9434_000727 [Picochlorum sp. BPE23]|nr:hypothetical protein M9434_000727 [Picochlorum sp. BPE23]